MYLIQIDHRIYERRGGGAWSLPDAMREVHGTRGARVLRLDGTPVVTSAGSDYAVTYAPTGRTVERRRVRR